MGLFARKGKAEREMLNCIYLDQVDIAKIRARMRRFLLDQVSVDITSTAINKEKKISSLIIAAKSSETLRQGILRSGNFLCGLVEIFDLAPTQLKFVCLCAGHEELADLAERIDAGGIDSGYLPLSDEYLEAITVKSFSEAVDKMIDLHEHDPKSHVDRFLRAAGYSGFPAIKDATTRALADGRVIQAPAKSFFYTIHDGNWIIAEDIASDPSEFAKGLAWLACAELGVPIELRDDLTIQIGSEFPR